MISAHETEQADLRCDRTRVLRYGGCGRSDYGFGGTVTFDTPSSNRLIDIPATLCPIDEYATTRAFCSVVIGVLHCCW